MSVEIDLFTGATPTITHNVTSVKFNREDTQSGTTAIPTPTSTGTNFSFVKTFQLHITATNGLTMTNAKVGKTANESVTGTKLWYRADQSTYTQATAAPASTNDNNVTAPAIPHSGDNTGVSAMSLISSAPVYYTGGAGSGDSTGQKGNYVQVCLGIDATNTTAGQSVSVPTIRWQWTEG
jgi:hypothetical protein